MLDPQFMFGFWWFDVMVFEGTLHYFFHLLLSTTSTCSKPASDHNVFDTVFFVLNAPTFVLHIFHCQCSQLSLSLSLSYWSAANLTAAWGCWVWAEVSVLNHWDLLDSQLSWPLTVILMFQQLPIQSYQFFPNHLNSLSDRRQVTTTPMICTFLKILEAVIVESTVI